MKKTIIWIVIIVVLVLVIGLNIRSLITNSKLETNEYEIKEEFKDIRIITDVANIEFVATEGKTLVNCKEQRNVNHLVKVEDNVLLIKIDDTRKWYEHIGINNGTPKITIHLNENEYGKLYAKSDVGNINIPNDFKFESIEILEDVGNIQNYASVYNDIKIKTDVGNINIEDITANVIDLSTSIGNVNIVNTNCVNLISKGNTGDIFLKNVIATEKFLLESDTGNIEFEASDAHDIFIKTDTGDVKGSFITDKVIFAESDTGNINVPKIMADEKCEIITDTGDIKITIDSIK